MKKRTFTLISIAMSLLIVSCNTSTEKAEKITYEPTWESLKSAPVPEWIMDAKFGIYTHWGVYSVPAFETNVYGQHMYSSLENDERGIRKHHEENYGSIFDFGYKEFVPMFTTPKFDPVEWVDVMKSGGVKFAGICLVHHDGFCLWDSEYTKWDSKDMGPKRDIYGELATEIRKQDLHLLATFHHARTYGHHTAFADRAKYSEEEKSRLDIYDPQYNDFYRNPKTVSMEEFGEEWQNKVSEVIDKYQPDAFWFDGGGGKYDTEEIIAHFFNNGIKNNKEVCIHNKGNFGENFGVYSYENGAHRPSYVDWPWEDDTPSATGWCDWQWDKNIQYKKSQDVIVRLVDLVSRNGGLLLSMNPRPDGSLDKGQEDLLMGIGKWLEQNGEAIYGTRPWKIYGEGHLENLFYTETNPVNGTKSRAIQPNTDLFTWEDVRFTTKENNLFACVLGMPLGKDLKIKSLGNSISISDKNKITSIELLGFGKVKFSRYDDFLLIHLPEQLPNTIALAFKIQVKGLLEKRVNAGTNSNIPEQT